MQIASKQCLWRQGGTGTEVEVVMTPETGPYVAFSVRAAANRPVRVSWGDGTESELPSSAEDSVVGHEYASCGRYVIVFKGICNLGFRFYDGAERSGYEGAVTSVVDWAGQITASRSGAFEGAANLRRFVAPNCTSTGQRDFADCTGLKEVVLGSVSAYGEAAFGGCTALTDFTAERSVVCGGYVWLGCRSLATLSLPGVRQLAALVFGDTPLLKDIWMPDRTVDQIRQQASEGNVKSPYGPRFPWGASDDCRFHGTDGIVLGDGTRIA